MSDIIRKLEKHPAVVKMDFIRDLNEQIKRLFNPTAGKLIVTYTDSFIQVTVFPKRDAFKWVGEEPIIHEIEID